MKIGFDQTASESAVGRQPSWVVDSVSSESIAEYGRLSLALEAGRLGTFSVDLATGQMDCSPQCKANFGQSPEGHFEYDALLGLIHEEDRLALLDAVERALRDHNYYEAEYRIQMPNGSTRWIAARGRALYALDGAPSQIVGVTQDVTKQRHAEEALRVSEAAVQERERRIRSLYALTSRTDISFTEKVNQLLKAGHDWLGLDAGILANIDCAAGVYTISQIAAAKDGFTAGFACPLAKTFCSVTMKYGPDSPPLAVEHAGKLPEWQNHPAYLAFRCEAYLGAVIRVGGGRAWGSISFFSMTPREDRFSEFDIDMARLMAQWIGGEIARQEAEEALRNGAAQQRRFVRQMLSSVTEGKLCLCDTNEDFPGALIPVSETIELTTLTLRDLRNLVKTAAVQLAFSPERMHDLITAVGEAAMNAVRHGGGGLGRVYLDPDRQVVQVWIEDHGDGIREEDLHRATLEKGWSSAGTFGHGFYLMLRTVDRTFLLTGTDGTTVVLEQEASPPQPSWI